MVSDVYGQVLPFGLMQVIPEFYSAIPFQILRLLVKVTGVRKNVDVCAPLLGQFSIHLDTIYWTVATCLSVEVQINFISITPLTVKSDNLT